MRKRYRKEFLTRRAIIQAIYINLCDFDHDLVNTVSNDEHILAETELDNLFLSNVLNKALENWEEFSVSTKKDLVLSRCGQAIMRAAKAELEMKQTDEKIILDEYIEFSKMFCENETKFINKLLADMLNSSAINNAED